MDLTEAEDIKKRWQEYTEERYKNILMTQITNHQARHPESKVRWDLGRITMNKASGAMEFQLSYFKS